MVLLEVHLLWRRQMIGRHARYLHFHGSRRRSFSFGSQLKLVADIGTRSKTNIHADVTKGQTAFNERVKLSGESRLDSSH